MPGTPEYKSALETIYGKPGVPDNIQPVVDMLGRKIKEKDMPIPRGGLFNRTNNEGRRLMVFKDHNLVFPDLNLKIYLQGPEQDIKGFPSLFVRAYCEAAESIDDADVVLFGGGPDVDPAYYGQKPHCMTYTNEDRDYEDIAVYLECCEKGIPMIGVCRGAQFGAVMHGAKLYQHIDGHQTDHPMLLVKEKISIDKVSSVHHQSVIPCEGIEVLAISSQSRTRYRNDNESSIGVNGDVEAFFIRDTCFFGVQGHPEYKDYNAYAKWFLEQINELVILNEDIEWRDFRRRLKKEFLEEIELKNHVQASK